MSRSPTQTVGLPPAARRCLRAATIAALAIVPLPTSTSLLTHVAAVVLTKRQEPEVVIGEVKYDVSPRLPAVNEMADQGMDRAGDALSAAAEVHAAEARQHAADAAVYSNGKMRDVIRLGDTSARAFSVAKEHAFAALKASEKAAAAVQKVKELFHSVDDVAHAAAQQAVGEVVAARKAKLGGEASRVRAEVEAQKKALVKAASEKAQDVAFPFQQAKIRAEKNVIDYLLRARELIAAVTKLKGESVKVATLATELQGKGMIVEAQEKMMQAHDVMDKAKQLEAQANQFTSLANQINGEMGLYDLAAGGAAAYGGFSKNPGGDDFSLPALPGGVEYSL